MSVLRAETMRVVAQTLGLDDLSDACVRELLPEVELRVRELVQDALKFKAHARRPLLMTAHVNQALRARHLEGLYGFGAPGAARFRACPEHPTLFFLDDDELDLSELLNAPLPPLPLHPTLHVHWLAVEGTQPRIPENAVAPGTGGGVGSGAAGADSEGRRRTSIRDEAFTGTNVERKPLVKHVLTEEMQLYYTKVTEALKSGEPELQRAAYASLAQDPGIHQLLPYLSRFVYDEVKHSNHALPLLSALMRVCRCLLANQSLQIELYLHQLLPAILTCVLGKQLSENPADDHWTLRKYAANLVADICQRYGATYEKIQARVSKTYHRAITDPLSAFTTQYGALYGMMYLGPLVLEDLLFPNLEQYYKRLEPALASSNPNLVERLAAQNCLGILVHASGMYFSMSRSTERPEADAHTAVKDVVGLLYDAFGEALVPYTSHHGPSTMLDMCL